ncbi:MAG TPA: hypothetical protein VGG31_01595 [Candidatus Dormibacteraeota bacterium]|jgi:hypothetical protein
MPIALIVGPAVAVIGIVSVFFVLRRKSVDKRSMYSARRSQIEHKVRAARQRTLTSHGRSEKPAEVAAPSPSGTTWASPAAPAATYQAQAYEPPAPAATLPGDAAAPPSASPWDVGAAASAPAAPPFASPAPQPEPFMPEPFAPAPEPAYQPSEPAYAPPEPAYRPPEPASGESAWTPGAPSSEPSTLEPLEPAKPAAAGAAWSVVGESSKDAAISTPEPRKGAKGPTGSWSLASGDRPGSEPDDAVKPPSATIAIAQYAILVIGLIMVLIGVVVMVANSHVT